VCDGSHQEYLVYFPMEDTARFHSHSRAADRAPGRLLPALAAVAAAVFQSLVLAAVAVAAAKYLLHALAAAAAWLLLVRAAAAAAVCLFHVLAAAAKAQCLLHALAAVAAWLLLVRAAAAAAVCLFHVLAAETPAEGSRRLLAANTAAGWASVFGSFWTPPMPLMPRRLAASPPLSTRACLQPPPSYNMLAAA
jgi:hypothetical protein